jgi:hypothetical protein
MLGQSKSKSPPRGISRNDLTTLCLFQILSASREPSFEMNMENVIPRLNLTSVSHQQALNMTVVQPPSEFIPRPPAAALKISHTPSLRQSNTALIPQLTPAMIGKTSCGSELPYKKILRGRLGVRSHRETQLQPSKPCEPLGSQTFRSTMEVLNSRCGSSSARASCT